MVELGAGMRHEPQPLGGRADGPGLAELAGAQHGVVSTGQLLRLGHSRAGIRRAVLAGRLHRIHHSVYAVGHRNLSLHGRCMAGVLTCGPGAVLSHHSAAWAWGIARWSPVPIHATGPIARAGRLPVQIHRARRLAGEDRDVREGLPVTAVPRTMLDLAATVSADRLRRLLERCDEMRLLGFGEVGDLLERSRGHHGRGRLRDAVAFYRPTSFTRSRLEARFLELCLAAGLPQPRMNFVEAGYELDAYWPAVRFAVELDAFETHGSRAAFERDRERQEELLLAGITVTRLTAARLEREPERTIERIARLLEARVPR